MGLHGVDENTGVSFKNRPQTNKSRKVNKNEKKSGLVIEKPKPVVKPIVNNIVEDLKAMGARDNITYKALIDGNVLDYDYATDDDNNDGLYKADCLGRGIAVESTFNPDVISGTIIDSDSRLLYFWKKIPDVDNDVVIYKNDIENIVDGGQDDLTDIVKQNEEEDLTMKTNKEFTKANEILATLKESGDAGVDVLIDYCKISFAEVFTKTNDGADSVEVTTDLQEQIVYIISEINKNDLLSPESKARLTSAIDAESKEYQKLYETLNEVSDDTKQMLEKKDNDTDWGTVALWTIGAIVAIGGAYSLYRYFEPGDVVLDMSTMSIMNR